MKDLEKQIKKTKEMHKKEAKERRDLKARLRLWRLPWRMRAARRPLVRRAGGDQGSQAHRGYAGAQVKGLEATVQSKEAEIGALKADKTALQTDLASLRVDHSNVLTTGTAD